MEILQFLLSLLNENYSIGWAKPVLELLQKNSFDIKKTLSCLSPETIAPIVKEFLKTANKKPPTEHVGGGYGLSPIAEIADKDVVYTLNKYFHG